MRKSTLSRFSLRTRPKRALRRGSAKKVKVLLENDFALFRACFYIVRILKNFYFLRGDSIFVKENIDVKYCFGIFYL